MKYITIILALVFIGCSQTNELIIKPTKPYGQILSDVENQRVAFNLSYQDSGPAQKKEVIASAKQFMFNQLTLEIFPSWYGTKWDFNGVTETPKEGHIACGYFVTTTLRDLGLKVPRIKWAQAASETMIIAATKDVKRFSSAKMDDVKSWIKSRSDAIYIVGLDNHTGFV